MVPKAWDGHIGYPPPCSGMTDLCVYVYIMFLTYMTYTLILACVQIIVQ